MSTIGTTIVHNEVNTLLNVEEKHIIQKWTGLLATTSKWEGFHGQSREDVPLFIPKLHGSNSLCCASQQ